MSVQDLNRQLHEVANEMRELGNQEQWGEEDKEKFERLNDAADVLEEKLAIASRADSLIEQTTATPEPEVAHRVVEPEKETDTERYSEVFEKYLRFGKLEMTPEERAILKTGYEPPERRAGAQVVGTDALGGYGVPQGPMQTLQQNMLTFGGLRRAPITIFPTADGRAIPIPTDNDTGNSGVILAEFTEESNTADVVVGQKVLNAYKFSSKFVKASEEMIADANFDVTSWLAGKIGTRLGRGLAPYLVNGDGVAEPEGLDAAAGLVTAAGAAAVTRADVLNLIHSIDPAYREDPSFGLVFNDTTLKALRALDIGTSDGRPLWEPSMRDGAPATIEGHPYWIVTEVSDIGAGNRFMFAGALSKFWLRDAGPARIYRLDERYREFDVVAFIGFSRHDSVIVDAGTAPIKYLRNPAS